MSRRVLLYINQIAPDEWTGQGGFERGVIDALRRRMHGNDTEAITIVSIYQPGGPRVWPGDGPETIRLLLDKHLARGYLRHQVRLALTLLRLLWRYRRDDVAIYVRHSLSMVAPPLAALLVRRPYTLRSGPIEGYQRQQYGVRVGLFLSRALRLLMGFNIRVARRIVVVSPVTSRSLLEVFPAARGKFALVRNGVDASRFVPVERDRAQWGLPDDARVAGYVGHIDDLHDLDTVIRGFARVPAIDGRPPWLLVVGDGPSEESMRALAAAEGIAGRAVWAGRRSQEEVASAIAACDVMIGSMSAWSLEVRGSSMVKLYEYLACDRPVLASRAPDHQFIEDSGVGWQATAGDVGDWARAFEVALREPGTRRSPREVAIAEHSFDQVAARIWDAAFGGPVDEPDFDA